MRQANLELHLTSWRTENGTLFDYKTEDFEEARQFKAVVYRLALSSAHPIYLFFHQPHHPEHKHLILLEQRRQLLSCIDSPTSKLSLGHTLLAGVEITFPPDQRDPRVRALPAQTIPVHQAYGHFSEERSPLLPFWVVRTFPMGLQLKVGQHLQLGRQEFRIEEVNLAGMNQGEHSYREEDVLNLDSMVEESRQSALERGRSSDRRQCRFCLSEDEDEEDPLISACDCRGSTGLVHVECLTKWVTTKMKKQKSPEEGGMYELQRLFCEICKKRFPKLIVKNGRRFSLLSFLENDSSAYLQVQAVPNEPHQDYSPPQEQQKMYISFMEEKEIKIGRQEENGVLLTDGSVSRQHAKLQLLPTKMVIKDRESKYGTLIHEPGKSVPLPSNQLRAFQVGPVAVCFTRTTHI